MFDAYLMVDWSANSTPKTGKDSIWCGLLTRSGDDADVVRLDNPPTRTAARALIGERLHQLLGEGAKVLVGFDFPYGYPTGTARHLGQADVPWRQTWRVLRGCIEDKPDNRNNRYEVAAALNRRLSGSPYPFWGCPAAKECNFLKRQRHKTPTPPGTDLPQYRITETKIAGPQSVWKLFYRGCVGSQALLGIPVLDSIRHDDPQFASISRVWPFETGPGHGETVRADQWRIIHAEIYPSIVRLPSGTAGEVKDASQVKALARHFAELDENDGLRTLFEAPASLAPLDRERVEQEEGWILGAA